MGRPYTKEEFIKDAQKYGMKLLNKHTHKLEPIYKIKDEYITVGLVNCAKLYKGLDKYYTWPDKSECLIDI